MDYTKKNSLSDITTHTHTHIYTDRHTHALVLTLSTYIYQYYYQTDLSYTVGPSESFKSQSLKPYTLLAKYTYRLAASRLGDIHLRNREGQDEWLRRMSLRQKAIRRRAHPSWLNV